MLVIAAGATFYLQPLWVNDQIIRYKLWREHVQSRYVVVDGYNLHYFEAGTAGTPLVLIHGLGSRSEDWAPLIASFAAHGYHVYVPDLLGFGRSPRPDVDYAISLQEQTVHDFMGTLHLGPADVGGWSMGGWVALKLTADYPGEVSRLVVFDSAGIYFPPTFDASLFIPADDAALTRLTTILSPKPKHLPGFAARAAIRRLQHNGWVVERSVDAMENGKDLLDFRLASIHTPTLVVWGAEDHLIPVDVGQTMQQEIPGASMVKINGCGHLAPSECPKAVLNATINFLGANPVPPPSVTSVDGTQP